MMEYEALSSSSSIRRYRRALKDEEFQAFLAFRETEDFAKIKSVKQVLTDPMIRKYNLLYYSSYYKNYLKVLNSPDVKRLAELEEEVHKEDFQKRHALWADSKRWQHSDQYKAFARYQELANSDDLYSHPMHPYTRALLSAIPQPNPLTERKRQRVNYVPERDHDYSHEKPEMHEVEPEHFVYCSASELERYRQELNGAT